MQIYRKNLNGSDNMAVHDALFRYAKEVLGDAWTFTPSVDSRNSQLIFTDSSGREHGWNFISTTEAGEYISEGVRTKRLSESGTRGPSGDFTGVVWKTNSGSVGLGLQSSAGKDLTWYTLIKFDGTYNGKDVYGVGAVTGNGANYGSIFVHGNVDIATANVCHHDATRLGSGVYLHPLYDPVSGLVSSDIFGVRSMDTDVYGQGGLIVTQGGTSYLSILGIPEIKQPMNTLFAKI